MTRRPDAPGDTAPALPWFAVVVVAAGAVAHANSLTGPCFFDDIASIRDNPNIRRLWPPWRGLAFVGRKAPK